MPECDHEILQFNSGDYYLTCTTCKASWMRRDPARREYGEAADGTKIGAAPELSNIGFTGALYPFRSR